MSVDKIDRILTAIRYVGYVINFVCMFALIIIEISMKVNPILIAILSFLYSAYAMLCVMLMVCNCSGKLVDE